MEDDTQDFRNLRTWQKAHALAVNIYKSTCFFPKSELFGITSQMRRASLSIPSNIAEGCGRDGDAELKRFLQIAQGSASELESQLLLAYDLEFLKDQDYQTLDKQIKEVRRMLSAFIQKLKTKS